MQLPAAQSDAMSKQTSSTVIQGVNKVVGKEDSQINVDFASSVASVSSKAVSKKRQMIEQMRTDLEENKKGDQMKRESDEEEEDDYEF